MEKYFLEFDDPNAQSNYARARLFIPDLIRIKTDKGIHESHKMCGSSSLTYKFMVIDADAFLLDDFDLSYIYDNLRPEPCVQIYRAINPINDLVYGHGGIKIFDKRLFTESNSVDFSTSFVGNVHIAKKVLNIHKFNTTEFHTWRTAFRECAKLSAGIIKARNYKDDEHRLNTWCNGGLNALYGPYSVVGANQGSEHGRTGNIDAINDFKWLRSKFEEAQNVLEA